MSSTARSSPLASDGTPSIASGADHGAPGPGPRSDQRLALADPPSTCRTRGRRRWRRSAGCRAARRPSPGSISAGGVGAVQPGADSVRYAVSTLLFAIHAAVTRPMPSTAARSRSVEVQPARRVAGDRVVVPPLHPVPGSASARPSGSAGRPSCQNTVARPLLGATTRSEMLSVSAGPASGDLRRPTARCSGGRPRRCSAGARDLVRVGDGDVARGVALDVRAVRPRRRDRLELGPRAAERAARRPDHVRMSAVSRRLPRRRSRCRRRRRRGRRLPPASTSSGISCAASTAASGALVAHIRRPPSIHTAVIRPCGSTPTAPPCA